MTNSCLLWEKEERYKSNWHYLLHSFTFSVKRLDICMNYYFPHQDPVSRKCMTIENTEKPCFSKSQLNHSTFRITGACEDGGIFVGSASESVSKIQKVKFLNFLLAELF